MAGNIFCPSTARPRAAPADRLQVDDLNIYQVSDNGGVEEDGGAPSRTNTSALIPADPCDLCALLVSVFDRKINEFTNRETQEE